MSAPSGMVIGSPVGWRPHESERWRGPGLWLALGAHGLLLLGLALSVNWKMSDPAPVEAEVWSEIPRVAGGAVPPPPPQQRRTEAAGKQTGSAAWGAGHLRAAHQAGVLVLQ